MHSQLRALFLSIGILLSGCDSIEKATARHRAQVDPKVTSLEALANKSGGLTPSPISALTPAPRFSSYLGPEVNAIVVQDAALSPLVMQRYEPLRQEPRSDSFKPDLDFGATCARVAATLNRSGQLPSGLLWELKPVEECLAAVARLDYALVVVTRKAKRAHLGLLGAGGQQTFIPGDYQADAFLFDLKNGQSLGGFSFRAAIVKERLTVRTQETFDQELRSAIRRALGEAIRANIPGAVFEDKAP